MHKGVRRSTKKIANVQRKILNVWNEKTLTKQDRSVELLHQKLQKYYLKVRL